MNKEQKNVYDWHVAMGRSDINKLSPGFPDDNVCALRLRLIQEEADELRDAIASKDLTGVADALGDLLYVVYGAGCAFGLDLEQIFDEINRSNMTKQGAADREDGKIQKGPNYEPPRISPIIASQAWIAENR